MLSSKEGSLGIGLTTEGDTTFLLTSLWLRDLLCGDPS